MPDYIYLLENRLSADQRNALAQLRTAARDAGTILFLTGDAVRDLTSGHAVRELEVAFHGNAVKLKKPLEKLGGKVWGEDEFSRSLYLCFPGTVRVNVVSTHRVEYPKPGKPVIHPASIHEDLRRRDFTVNSMAISLNEGSYGLLMDPLNGAADIEMRVLRLVSNYGFIEDPALLIRATRYRTRLGWEMDPRTQTRYDNAKNENVMEYLSAHARKEELEQIGHEEDGLKVLRALEDEGWMKILFPAWTSAKADEAKLNALHDLVAQLQVQGVHPDMSAAQMQLLTAKLPSRDLSALKKSLLRPGFVEEWSKLDSLASGFAKTLLSKQNAKPSACFKLFMSYDPEAILWLGFASKDKTVQERFNLFLKVWPEAHQRIPHLLMQEMRITPELPAYKELVEKIFLELIDGKLTTPEEMRAFLEPYSPPAPPPQVTIKRSRARRAGAKIKEQAIEDEDSEDALPEEDLDTMGGDDEELDLAVLPKGALADGADEDLEGEDEEDLDGDDEDAAPSKKPAGKKGQKPEPVIKPAAGIKAAAGAKLAGKPAAKPVAGKAADPAAPAKSVPAKSQPVSAPKKPDAAPAKTVAKPTAKPVKVAVKVPAKKLAPAKAARPKPKARPTPKPVKKAHAKPSKPVAKKPAPKAKKKR
ncbi:MAG TPA: CCA tRNA nucleotidyltransferase [Terracidiphilus sp.]|jgi:tRNA nucleotidyltransferase/poly(A) polymerase